MNTSERNFKKKVVEICSPLQDLNRDLFSSCINYGMEIIDENIMEIKKELDKEITTPYEDIEEEVLWGDMIDGVMFQNPDDILLKTPYGVHSIYDLNLDMINLTPDQARCVRKIFNRNFHKPKFTITPQEKLELLKGMVDNAISEYQSSELQFYKKSKIGNLINLLGAIENKEIPKSLQEMTIYYNTLYPYDTTDWMDEAEYKSELIDILEEGLYKSPEYDEIFEKKVENIEKEIQQQKDKIKEKCGVDIYAF